MYYTVYSVVLSKASDLDLIRMPFPIEFVGGKSISTAPNTEVEPPPYTHTTQTQNKLQSTQYALKQLNPEPNTQIVTARHMEIVFTSVC